MSTLGLGRDAHRVTAGSRNVAFSLRIRRTWYADDGQPPPTPPTFEEQIKALPEAQQTLFADMLKELKDTRTEAAERRRALNALQEAESKREVERKAAEEKALQEQGQFRQLYEKQSAEMAQLQAYKARVDALELTLTAQLETRKKGLPPHIAELISKLSVTDALAWLDANADKINTPNAPGTDAGQRGTRQPQKATREDVLGNTPIPF